MKWTYLIIDIATILIPLTFSFHPRIRFDKVWKHHLPALLLTAVVFILWDALFTSLGVWNFNPRYLLGINILGLPLEEILFFICIPYACVFTFFCLDKYYKLSWNTKMENACCLILIALLLIGGVLSLPRLYTSVTFISASLLVFFVKFIQKADWTGKSISVYGILLIPFLIVNGLLTGTGLDEPVVLYNDNENLGIRILTIPIEDIIYGFEMLLLNLSMANLLARGLSRKFVYAE